MGFSFERAVAGAKALPAHPALQSREPVTTYSPGRPREDAVISQREASRHADAYGGSQAIDWVYDCIGLYSDAVSSAPYRLEKPDGTKLERVKTKGTPPDHEVGPADLYQLLDKPNPYVLYDELMALLVIDLLLVGNAYWFKWRVLDDGRPLALYRLAPSHVKIKPGPYGPKAYEYKPPGVRDKLRLSPEQIIHFRRPNPHSNWYGMGVIQGAGRSMDLELAITDTMASYYENKADPSMIVASERRVPRDVFNKLRAQLRARAGGSRNAGELLVLEAGLKASSLSTSASDALFDKLSKMSRDRVFTKFRASPMLFGLMDEAAGSNKVSDARREFDNYTLRPFMGRISTQVTTALAEPWGVKYLIDHRQILPAEEQIKVAESIAKAPGVKVREVRKQYEQFGVPESSGDEEIDELIINVPGEELDEDGQGGFADQPLGGSKGEPGRPPKVGNTVAFGVAKDARVRGTKAVVDEVERVLDNLIAQGKSVPAERPAETPRLPGEKRPDDNFAAARRVDIDGATAFIAAGLREASVELERGLLDAVEGKALKSSDIVQRLKRSDAWQTFKRRVEEVLTEGIRRAAASGVMHSGQEPDEDVDYDGIVKTILHRPEGGLRTVLGTLRDRVANRVKEAREKNAERTEYESAVRAVIAEWADTQTVAIADSEATEAYNEGTLTAGEMSGIDSWLVIEEDDAPDEACQDARYQVWDTEKARANRKQHPRCRRAFLALPEGAVG